jgi:modulator of FtsH protease
MLGLTMIPTVIGAYLGMSLNFAFAAEHPFMFAIGMLAVMMGLFFGINATRDSGLGVVLLLVLTGFMGVMLGRSCRWPWACVTARKSSAWRRAAPAPSS